MTKETDEETLLTQEKVNELVGKARQEARQKAEEQYEAKMEELAEEQARDQKEWKSLAEERKAKLEPLQERIERYDDVIQGMLDSRVEELRAKSIVEALPDVMSPLDKLNWLNMNVKLFKGKEQTLGTPLKPTRSQGELSKPEKKRRLTL